MMSKADKLPLETKPGARDNDTSWTLKPGACFLKAPETFRARKAIFSPSVSKTEKFTGLSRNGPLVTKLS